jgi:hypothetical protein
MYWRAVTGGFSKLSDKFLPANFFIGRLPMVDSTGPIEIDQNYRPWIIDYGLSIKTRPAWHEIRTHLLNLTL